MPWSIDVVHTHIGFSTKHMMVSTVRGQFREYRGTVTIDPTDFTRSSFEGEIDVASIDTGVAQRDDHLRNSDFFDAHNHPKILFKSTRVESKGDNEYVVHGDITIRGVQKPIALEVEFHGTSKNPWGKTVSGLSARDDQPQGLRRQLQRAPRGGRRRGQREGEDRARGGVRRRRSGRRRLTRDLRQSTPWHNVADEKSRDPW